METTMIEENLARLRSHRNNIHRYRRLLATRLSELERSYVERRLQEEQSSLDALTAETFPFTLSAIRPTHQNAA
jgi:hypothetical protein